MEYKIIKAIGVMLMVGAGIDALASRGGDEYNTMAIAEAVIGSGLYLSAYLREIRDNLKTRNTNPSELETKVDNE